MTTSITDEQLARLREEVRDHSAVSVLPGLLARLDAAEERVRELEKERDELMSAVDPRYSTALDYIRDLEQSDMVRNLKRSVASLQAKLAQARRDALLEAAAWFDEDANRPPDDRYVERARRVASKLRIMAGEPKCDT